MAEAAFPHMSLDLGALENNIGVMAAWCDAHDVLLAPHVKTTMSAPIIDRQLAAGAVGVTVATVEQAATVASWGHRRILIANEIVDHRALGLLRAYLQRDPALRIRCLIDSPDGVEAAQRVFGTGGPRLEVLLDVGTPGGRTGVRDRADARVLAEATNRSSQLALVGVAGYEGVVPNSRDGTNLARVDEHCRRVRDVFLDAADLYETNAPVFSMGGSAFPDRVVRHLPDGRDAPGTVRLVRPGCYVTHDHGTYAHVSPIPGLLPAVTVRAVVLSAPEPGLAVIGAGRRELPHDAGLPTVLTVTATHGDRKPEATARVQTLFDHHAVLTEADDLKVSDVVELGISHPCSVFSRWDDYLVTRAGETIGIWETGFGRRSAR